MLEVQRPVRACHSRQLQEAAGALVSRAMVNAAPYAQIFHSLTSSDRQSELQWLFTGNIDLVLQKNAQSARYYVDGQGSLVCFYILEHSADNAGTTLMDKVRCGFGALPFRKGGISCTLNLLASGAYFGGEIGKFMNGRPHLDLGRMSVDPSYQSTGIGSKCLVEAFKEADELNLPIVLAAHNERNIKFYERLGFKVVHQAIFKPNSKNLTFHSAFMVREPNPKLSTPPA